MKTKMTKKYTKHMLTDAELIRLSQAIYHQVSHYGPAMQALLKKGLVYENEYGKIQANGNGIRAFEQARVEGW